MSKSLTEETYDAREQLYASIGEVEPSVMGHIISPSFTGGPAWPTTRQAFSIIRRNANTMVITNGLADPFDDTEERNSGFNIEIYAETSEPVAPVDGDLKESAVFRLVYATAKQAAHSGQFVSLLEQYGVVSMELYAEDCGLQEYQNENGMVGVIIGIEHPDFSNKVTFPGGEVVLASVQILTTTELEYLAANGTEGRNNLHEKFKSSGVHHLLSPNRDSLVSKQVKPAETVEETRPVAPPVEQAKPWWKFWKR